MVMPLPSKQESRVRFPPPAPNRRRSFYAAASSFFTNYSVSYVPGCGITQYVGNHGETFTVASVGSYPALGTQMTTKMASLTLMDDVRSLAKVIASGARWRPFASVR